MAEERNRRQLHLPVDWEAPSLAPARADTVLLRQAWTCHVGPLLAPWWHISAVLSLTGFARWFRHSTRVVLGAQQVFVGEKWSQRRGLSELVSAGEAAHRKSLRGSCE